MNCAMMGSNNGTMTDFEIPPLFEFTQNGTDVKIAPKERFEKNDRFGFTCEWILRRRPVELYRSAIPEKKGDFKANINHKYFRLTC